MLVNHSSILPLQSLLGEVVPASPTEVNRKSKPETKVTGALIPKEMETGHFLLAGKCSCIGTDLPNRQLTPSIKNRAD